MKKKYAHIKGDIPEIKSHGFVMQEKSTTSNAPVIAFSVTVKDNDPEEEKNSLLLEEVDDEQDNPVDEDLDESSDEEVEEDDDFDYDEEDFEEEDDADDEDDEEFEEYDEEDESDEEEEEDDDSDPEDREEDVEKESFQNIPLDVSKLGRSISKISNMIKEYIHSEDVYGMISDYVTAKKYYADEFYQKVQNSVYHTLMEYCKVSKNEQGEEVVDMDNMTFERLQTLRFFDRVYNDRNVSRELDPHKLIEKYATVYTDSAYMIDSAWIDLLNFRLTPRIPIPDNRIEIIGNAIRDGWCISPVIPQNHPMKSVPIEEHEYHCEDCASENEEFVRVRPMRLYRYKAKDSDVLYVASDDGIRVSIIPFYEFRTYENMDVNLQENGLITHEKNGAWDWLTHFRPGTRFMTKDCDKYLALNDVDASGGIVSVILSEEEDGYLMGMYRIPYVVVDTEKENTREEFTEELLQHINTTISSCIGAISYLPQNTQYTEEEKKEMLANGEKLDAMNINYEDDELKEEHPMDEDKEISDDGPIDMSDVAAEFLVGDEEVQEEEGDFDPEEYEEYDSDSYEFSPIRKKPKMN